MYTVRVHCTVYTSTAIAGGVVKLLYIKVRVLYVLHYAVHTVNRVFRDVRDHNLFVSHNQCLFSGKAYKDRPQRTLLTADMSRYFQTTSVNG